MIKGGGYGILMTVAMTVEKKFLSVLRLLLVEWPDINSNLHHLMDVTIAKSVIGNTFIMSYENPKISCIIKPDNLTGIGRMPGDFGR